VRILIALLLLALPGTLAAQAQLPAAIMVPGALLLLTVPLAWSLRRRDDGGPLLLPAVRAAILLIILLALCALTGASLGVASWVLCIAVAVFVLLGRAPDSAQHDDDARWWLLGGSLLLVAIAVWRPLTLTLSSDAPAHVAAILDAGAAGRVRPPDLFFGATAGSIDPRFGIAHGLYAMIGNWTASTAAEALRWSAVFFSPLWFLAHALLMRRLGLGARSAVLAALVFTLYSGGGRAFGLAGAGFPGSVAQTLCALGLAVVLEHAAGQRRWTGVALIAVSALVHPFAWWATTIVMLCATMLLLFPVATRGLARGWAVMALVTLAAGVLLLLGRILSRGAASGGLHAQLNEVVFLGGPFFIADPFWVLRWGGWSPVLAAPALLLTILLVPRWGRQRDHLTGLAITLPVWLISLNPLAAPLAWPAVSYLVVRLGRIVLGTWVWVWMLRLGIERFRLGGRAALAAIVLVLIGLAGLQHEISTALLHLRQPQVIDGATTDAHMDALAAAIEPARIEWLLTDPRIGYGIRARGGPKIVLPPVAHASPNDVQLMHRLARWRELADPALKDRELLARLSTFGEAALLVDEQTVGLHAATRAYAYVPDSDRSARLRARLQTLGLPILTGGDRWTLFDLRELETIRVREPAGSVAEEEALAQGTALALGAVSFPDTTLSPGSTVAVEVEFLRSAESELPERLFLRLEGDMPEAPRLFAPVSKLWRKVVLERSGRSRSRFGQWVTPADLVVPARRWPDGRWTQTVLLRIPEWAAAGEYTVQATIHPWTWHESHALADYLNDTDSFSATAIDTVHITN